MPGFHHKICKLLTIKFDKNGYLNLKLFKFMKKLVYAHLPILALRICIPPMVVVREFFLSLWQTPRHQESDLLGYQIVLRANTKVLRAIDHN